MTASVLDVSAVVVGGLLGGITEWAGVQIPKCATCGQFGGDLLGRVPGHIYGSNWPWVPCRTCKGSGLAPVPSGPHTWRARVSDEEPRPRMVGDWLIVPPSSTVTGGTWIAQRWERSTVVERLTLPSDGSTFDLTVIQALPVVYHDYRIPNGTGQVAVKVHAGPGNGLSVVERRSGLLFYTDISDALPWGSWRPGVDMAIHVTQITPVEQGADQ